MTTAHRNNAILTLPIGIVGTVCLLLPVAVPTPDTALGCEIHAVGNLNPDMGILFDEAHFPADDDETGVFDAEVAIPVIKSGLHIFQQSTSAASQNAPHSVRLLSIIDIAPKQGPPAPSSLSV